MLHPDYPFWSFIGLIAVLLPLPWHWRARNVATLALMFWIALANLIVFVNSLVWADNFADHAPVWCDISESGFISHFKLTGKAAASGRSSGTASRLAVLHRCVDLNQSLQLEEALSPPRNVAVACGSKPPGAYFCRPSSYRFCTSFKDIATISTRMSGAE